MFNKVARLSPAFQGAYTLYESGGDIRNFTTMQIVDQGSNAYSQGSPNHQMTPSRMEAGWEDPGFVLAVNGWDVRFNIDLSSVPDRARYGKIRFSASSSYCYSSGTYNDADKIGKTQYRNSSGIHVDTIPAYGMGPSQGKSPGDCSFTTTDTVNDYFENQGGILQIRIVNIIPSSQSPRIDWSGSQYVIDDVRVQKIEIVGA